MFPVNDSVDNEFHYAVMLVYFEVRNSTQCYAAAHATTRLSIHMSGDHSVLLVPERRGKVKALD